ALPPKEDRLISYALDGGIEVMPSVSQTPQKMVSLQLSGGSLILTHKYRTTTIYTAKNRSPHDRVLLLEHPYRGDYKLVSKERPKEQASDVYRFEVKIPAGKSASQEIEEECDSPTNYTVATLCPEMIRHLLQGKFGNAKVKEALATVLEYQAKLT